MNKRISKKKSYVARWLRKKKEPASTAAGTLINKVIFVPGNSIVHAQKNTRFAVLNVYIMVIAFLRLLK